MFQPISLMCINPGRFQSAIIDKISYDKRLKVVNSYIAHHRYNKIATRFVEVFDTVLIMTYENSDNITPGRLFKRPTMNEYDIVLDNYMKCLGPNVIQSAEFIFDIKQEIFLKTRSETIGRTNLAYREIRDNLVDINDLYWTSAQYHVALKCLKEMVITDYCNPIASLSRRSLNATIQVGNITTTSTPLPQNTEIDALKKSFLDASFIVKHDAIF